MKRNLIILLTALVVSTSFSSCATVFGGKVTTAQRTKPLPGEPARKVRAVALIADIILFWPGLIVDFATHAIYKPDGNGMVKKDAPLAVSTEEKSI